jgi:hypothetical protein
MKAYIWISLVGYILYNQIVARWIEKTGEKYYIERQQANKTNPKVYDIVHKHTVDLKEYQVWNHVFTFALLTPLLAKLSVMETFISYWIPLFLLRSVFNMVTILPKNKTCYVNENTRFAFVGGCYDKVFSGHFASVLLALILYTKQGWITNSTAIILGGLNATGILLTRSHYTVDIVVAYLATMYMYQNGIKLG